MDFNNKNVFIKPQNEPKSLLGQTVSSPAKVNLTLDVLEREASGCHRILTIYHEVPSLGDELIFTSLDSPKIVIECEDAEIPLNSSNTILRAAQLIQKKYEIQKGVRVHLKKRIPIASGLGGGASNAATTLKALNQLWDLNISVHELISLAAPIGMDVPFFILGGAALGMHYGEHLMPLPTLKNHRIEIIPTDVSVSTRQAYATLPLEHCGKRVAETLKLQRILKGELDWNESIEPFLHNDFELEFFKKHPELKAKYPDAHLSGSGGALFRLV